MPSRSPREKSLPLIPPDVYHECFHRALRRMAVALNGNSLGRKRALELLSEPTGVLSKKVKAFNIARIEHSTLDDPTTDVDRWENFFYGGFEYRRRDKFLEITFNLREWFLQKSLDGVSFPADASRHFYVAQELDPGLEGPEVPFELLHECATNYLLKNFWHNFVHNRIQTITQNNYHHFSGQARMESDFEADCLANALLIHSYGMTVRTDATDIYAEPDKGIIAALRRNRCNRVFANRALETEPQSRSRSDIAGKAHDFIDKEWRYRRTLANYIGGYLLADGRAASSLRVDIVGKIRVKGGTVTREEAYPIVTVNSFRFRCLPIYSPGADAAIKHKHFQKVAEQVSHAYAERMREDIGARQHAKTLLEDIFRRAGVVC